MSKTRVTIETLRSGYRGGWPPRRYADTECVVRVSFERVPWNSKTGDFEPEYLKQDTVERMLLGLQCGFTSVRKKDASFMQSYLDYLRPIDEQDGRSSEWKFRVVSPFTD